MSPQDAIRVPTTKSFQIMQQCVFVCETNQKKKGLYNFNAAENAPIMEGEVVFVLHPKRSTGFHQSVLRAKTISSGRFLRPDRFEREFFT